MSGAWVAAFLALTALVVFAILVLVGLLRRVSGVLEQTEARLASQSSLPEAAGAAPGSVIGSFEVTGREGNLVSASDLVTRPSIVLLVAPDCRECKYLARELDGIGESIDDVPLLVLVQGSPSEDQLDVNGGVVFYDTDLQAARAFQSSATPVAFVLDVGGFVLDRTIPNSLDDLRVLALRQKGGALAAHA